jgi:hypothetical protein
MLVSWLAASWAIWFAVPLGRMVPVSLPIRSYW